jgi:hypothetical protein
VLLQRMGFDRVDLDSVYFKRDAGQEGEGEHDCSNSKACAIEGLYNEVNYDLY